MFSKVTARVTASRNFMSYRFEGPSESRFGYLRKFYLAFVPAVLMLFVFAFPSDAFGQSGPIDYRQQFNMPTITPPAPDAASIEKFGNIPVSYATGVPDISIPLYTIKCGNLTWPISLSYHAGGIRVDEIASSAGLGWSLNAQGVISRSRAGRPDEENFSEPIYTSVNTSHYEYLYSVLNGTVDSEQDVFNFSFNGRSGKFVVDQDGSIIQIPLSNLRITYTSGFGSFTITDENGIVYLFDQKEYTSSQSLPAEAIETYYTSSWYLTRVEMPDKNNTIQFSYVGAGRSTQAFPNFSQAVGKKYRSEGYGGGATISLYDFNERSSSTTFVRIDMVKLNGISFPNGSIAFTYDAVARMDVGTGTDVSNKLSSITINRQIHGATTQIKKFEFKQSYFLNATGATSADPTIVRRLRLDGLFEFGSNGLTDPKKYSFEYNTTPMAPRENFGQDIWGYNNGHYSNPSLLQSETITFDGGGGAQTYNIGDANRSVDPEQMKACMLSSIAYPTGGKTVFTFEPHVYSTEQTVMSTVAEVANVTGNQAAPQVSTTVFTFPTTADVSSTRVIVDMSRFDFPDVTQPSWVSIKDLTTGALFYVQSQQNPYQRVSWNEYISLEKGHSYELKSYVYSSTATNSQLNASIKLQWNNFTSTPDIRQGGGLRVKEIKNYAATGVVAWTEKYVYDTAVTLTPFPAFQRTYSEGIYRLGAPVLTNCWYYFSHTCRIYSSSSPYSLSTAMGSPMLYRKVQKFTTDAATDVANGKSEYRYDVFRDETYAAGGRYIFVPFLSNDWMNGSLVSETHYKLVSGVYSPVRKTEYKYSHYNATQSHSLRVQRNYIQEGCEMTRTVTTIATDATYYVFPIRSGSKRLWQQTETVYDDNQNKIQTHTYHDYASNKFDFPTKITVIDSKQNSDSVTFKRSPDFAIPGNVYHKMEQQNILAPVIIQKSYSNANLLNTLINNYRDWKSDGKVIALDYIQAATRSNALETRMQYYDYDNYANPLSVGKANDIKKSYLWGYNNSYPVAEVVNASSNEIFFDSFEDKAGWDSYLTDYDHTKVHSGRLAGRIVNATSTDRICRSTKWLTIALSAPRRFKFSGWFFSNGPSAEIFFFMRRPGDTDWSSFERLETAETGKWVYVEKEVTVPADVTGINLRIDNNSNGTVWYDDIRVHPADALMTTYTYDPLIGMTSQSDVNNNVTYYRYDASGRLSYILNKDLQVLKRFCYNYAGQQENCTIDLTPHWTGTGNFRCAKDGNNHNTGIEEKEEKDANPASESYGATRWVSNGVNTNSCPVPNQVTVSGTSYTSSPYNVRFTNTSTGIEYATTLYSYNSSSVAMPSGNYTVSFYPAGSPVSSTFSINGYTQYGTGATFYNIAISTGSYFQIY